jgi:hypothetical protein
MRPPHGLCRATSVLEMNGIDSLQNANAMRRMRVAVVVLVLLSNVGFLYAFFLLNLVFFIGLVAAMTAQLFSTRPFEAEEFVVLATLLAPCIATVSGLMAAASWAAAPSANASQASKAPSHFAAYAAALAIITGAVRSIELMWTDATISPGSYPVVAAFLLMTWIVISNVMATLRHRRVSPTPPVAQPPIAQPPSVRR